MKKNEIFKKKYIRFERENLIAEIIFILLQISFKFRDCVRTNVFRLSVTRSHESPASISGDILRNRLEAPQID